MLTLEFIAVSLTIAMFIIMMLAFAIWLVDTVDLRAVIRWLDRAQIKIREWLDPEPIHYMDLNPEQKDKYKAVRWED